MELVRPRLIILVGTLAIEQFLQYLPGRSLDVLVGTLFDSDGHEPLLMPLPHPSGASRWLNARQNRARLEEALQLLKKTWPTLVPAASS
jgi:uracil-DNA glycosylase